MPQNNVNGMNKPSDSMLSGVDTDLVRERLRVSREIAEFAAAYAGSELDLDSELEAASLEALAVEQESSH